MSKFLKQKKLCCVSPTLKSKHRHVVNCKRKYAASVFVAVTVVPDD